jgi:hypothetical protein
LFGDLAVQEAMELSQEGIRDGDCDDDNHDNEIQNGGFAIM